jgi:hypothetical protein
MNRDEFEKWAGNAGFLEDDAGNINLCYLGLHDAYVDGSVNATWRAWQACSRLYAKLTAEPTPGAMTLPGDFFSKGK